MSSEVKETYFISARRRSCLNNTWLLHFLNFFHIEVLRCPLLYWLKGCLLIIKYFDWRLIFNVWYIATLTFVKRVVRIYARRTILLHIILELQAVLFPELRCNSLAHILIAAGGSATIYQEIIDNCRSLPLAWAISSHAIDGPSHF